MKFIQRYERYLFKISVLLILCIFYCEKKCLKLKNVFAVNNNSIYRSRVMDLIGVLIKSSLKLLYW